MSLTTRVQRLVDELNPEQRAAVMHRGGPVLVLAGAGTGKTRVITVRIAQLLAEGMAADRVLALTFTNKAAGEMAERVAGFVGADRARAMTVGTFHSLGMRILDEDIERIGYTRGISLLDASDQASAVRQCLKQLKIDPKRHDPRVFLNAISNARNAWITPDQMAAQPARKLTAMVYRAYLQWLEAYQALDFDDLILRAVQLIRDHEDLRSKWRARFSTILVDEYQDTNGTQLELMRLLADEHRSLCVVGDDDQSIYGWRGANIENILGFERHFPDAEAIALTQNYRSTGHILAAANSVIGNNDHRRDKTLWTDVGQGEAVHVVACKDPAAEAQYVAAEIRRRHDQEQRPFRDFGVLFRTAAQAQPIEEALRLVGVPYRLVGAYEFYSRKEVKDALSYLRLVANPRDETSLLRIINFPQRGIGPKAIAALHDFARARRMSLYEAVGSADQNTRFNRPQQAALSRLHQVLTAARRFHRDTQDVAALLQWICAETGAREAWIRDPTEGPGGRQRWKNIELLEQGIQAFMARRPGADLREYLKAIALEGRIADEPGEPRDEIALMTLHAAKGLEWPICFVVGCQEGLIPHQRTLEDSGMDVSEERRLFYVGITRARRTSVLTFSRQRRRYTGLEPARPSRFLREIPKGHRIDVDRGSGGGEVDKSDARARFAALKARLSK